jgi:hypothetical protein
MSRFPHVDFLFGLFFGPECRGDNIPPNSPSTFIRVLGIITQKTDIFGWKCCSYITVFMFLDSRRHGRKILTECYEEFLVFILSRVLVTIDGIRIGE